MMKTIGDERNQYLEAWAKMMIQIWQDKIIAYGARESGELLKSLQEQVWKGSRGDIEKITFTFLYYGRMVDMGVGRGVKLEDAGPNSGRKKKPWYSKSFYYSVKVLTEKLAELYGEEFRTNIIQTLNS